MKQRVPHLDPARTVVAKVGGIQAVCAAVGVSRTAVVKWMRPREVGGTDGLIPSDHARRLYEYAREKGLPLKAEDFFRAA